MTAVSESSPPQRSRLRDVATRAGVSMQTVSNVLNGRADEMMAETKTRVESALEELNYVPNWQARSLRSQRTRTLALLLLDPDPRFLADPMTDLIISGVGAVARDRGYMLLIHAIRPNDAESTLLLPIKQNRADGALLLLSGKPADRRKFVGLMQNLHRPFVVFENVDDEAVSTVTAENRQGALAMTSHLLGLGHRRIAFIGTETPWPMIEQRFLGYRDALAAANVAFDPGLTRFAGEWDTATGGLLLGELRDEVDPPTALLAGNDLLAIGAIRAVRALGLAVPADFAVVGFDDFAFAEHTDPPLTTVRIPGFEMGHEAASMLIDQIEGIEIPRSRTVWPVELMMRGST